MQCTWAFTNYFSLFRLYCKYFKFVVLIISHSLQNKVYKFYTEFNGLLLEEATCTYEFWHYISLCQFFCIFFLNSSKVLIEIGFGVLQQDWFYK